MAYGAKGRKVSIAGHTKIIANKWQETKEQTKEL
jgi:hypothetical protein